jgi:hypothetical protein
VLAARTARDHLKELNMIIQNISPEISRGPRGLQAIDHASITYHFTRVSGNSKTGPMPVTTTNANSCPPTCRLKNNGCYADAGHLALYWRAVSRGQCRGTFDELLEHISTVRRNALWRHNQAGDLTPSVLGVIDSGLLKELALVNWGRRGFTYTHYPPIPVNCAAIREANRLGFTVNLSVETLDQADRYAALAIAPVVVVLPARASRPVRAPGGRLVIVCPASLGGSIV